MFDKINWLIVYLAGYSACWCILSLEQRSGERLRPYSIVLVQSLFWPIEIGLELAAIFYKIFKQLAQTFYQITMGNRT